MCQFYMSLGYGEERVEVTVSLHKLVEAAELVYAAVLQHKNAVVATQQGFLQSVGNHHPGNVRKIQNVA